MALWILATPIGTLGDLSPRAREVLAMVDVIASEDTRTTRRLLTAVEVSAPQLIALHAHNEPAIAKGIVARALAEEVALVSDAGTPGISDPGATVVTEAHRQGVEIRSVPGPSALATALAAAGFGAAPSTFLGFPPRKGRDGWAREVLGRGEVLVVYEAPSRIVDLLDRLARLRPERACCLCRELSKAHEEVRRGTLSSLELDLRGREVVKGECVLVIAAGEPLRKPTPMTAGKGLKSVAVVLADRWGITRREAYQRLLELDQEMGREE